MTLCVTSGKGGVGKTSFTVNFALALAQKGAKVLVVDGDMGLANIDVLLRLSVKKNISDIIANKTDPKEALIHPRPNLGVLPGSSGVPEMVSLGEKQQAQLGKFIQYVSKGFDYVIIDTAAGIGSSVLWFNKFVSHSIFILSSDPTSLTDAYALIKLLSKNHDIKRFNVVINFAKSRQDGQRTFETLEKVTRKFLGLNLEHLGDIPDDKAVRNAVLDQTPFIEKSPKNRASRAISDLADKIDFLI